MEALLFVCEKPDLKFARYKEEAVLINKKSLENDFDWHRVQAQEVEVGDFVSVPCVSGKILPSHDLVAGPGVLVRTSVREIHKLGILP